MTEPLLRDWYKEISEAHRNGNFDDVCPIVAEWAAQRRKLLEAAGRTIDEKRYAEGLMLAGASIHSENKLTELMEQIYVSFRDAGIGEEKSDHSE